jgi:L,D-peptidoglycan transpeptidase YkuD (ErfK/YbiS/YcfS/YnhG family)
MRYEFRNKLVARVGVAVGVATALLMAGCTGAARVAVPPAITTVPSSGSLAPAVVPLPPLETSIAALAATPTAAASPSTTKATVAPKPATTAPTVAWAACSATLGGVSVQVAAKQRTVTVVKGKGGSYATLSFWTRTTTSACGFVNVFTDGGARVGANGITNGATRTQGTSTTPSGTYTMTEAFGINGSPGSALTYRHVKADDFWVEDNNSAYYNSYRNVSQGGFDATLPLSDPNGSERLSNFATQYGYSIVVNFNRAPDRQTPYRGAGIFVHVRAGATAGCIATSSANVVTMLRTMRSGDTITIAA